MLCETARRLLSTVRGADFVARFGGDEFVIAYEPNDPNSDDLILRIEQALCAPIDLTPTTSVSCPASIGTAETGTVGHNAADLLAAADDAMYEMKALTTPRRASRPRKSRNIRCNRRFRDLSPCFGLRH